MNINTKFDIGQVVFLKTDNEQNERLITGIDIRESGIIYRVSFCETDSYHCGFELSMEKNVLKSTTN